MKFHFVGAHTCWAALPFNTILIGHSKSLSDNGGDGEALGH